LAQYKSPPLSLNLLIIVVTLGMRLPDRSLYGWVAIGAFVYRPHFPIVVGAGAAEAYWGSAGLGYDQPCSPTLCKGIPITAAEIHR
jgi:hypothetical protein